MHPEAGQVRHDDPVVAVGVAVDVGAGRRRGELDGDRDPSGWDDHGPDHGVGHVLVARALDQERVVARRQVGDDDLDRLALDDLGIGLERTGVAERRPGDLRLAVDAGERPEEHRRVVDHVDVAVGDRQDELARQRAGRRGDPDERGAGDGGGADLEEAAARAAAGRRGHELLRLRQRLRDRGGRPRAAHGEQRQRRRHEGGEREVTRELEGKGKRTRNVSCRVVHCDCTGMVPPR